MDSRLRPAGHKPMKSARAGHGHCHEVDPPQSFTAPFLPPSIAQPALSPGPVGAAQPTGRSSGPGPVITDQARTDRSSERNGGAKNLDHDSDRASSAGPYAAPTVTTADAVHTVDSETP